MAALSFPEKLQSWCVRFKNSLTVEAIEVLLAILRAENIPNTQIDSYLIANKIKSKREKYEKF